jgi:hypothetical protein
VIPSWSPPIASLALFVALRIVVARFPALRRWYALTIAMPILLLVEYYALRTDATFGLVLAVFFVLIFWIARRRAVASEQLDLSRKLAERRASAERRTPAQIVGASCVACGERIVTVTEGGPCDTCGAPLHDRCSRTHARRSHPKKEPQ